MNLNEIELNVLNFIYLDITEVEQTFTTFGWVEINQHFKLLSPSQLLETIDSLVHQGLIHVRWHDKSYFKTLEVTPTGFMCFGLYFK